MREKKKVILVDGVGCRYVTFWSRYVTQCEEVDLPKSLLEEPLLHTIFRDFGSLGLFFDGSKPFPVTFGAVVLAC